MPELPEVETMARGIAGLCGARIVAARFPQGPCRPLAIAPDPTEIAARLAGHRIVSVARFGKRVAIEVGGEESTPHWLVIEPRMTGHVRMELELDTGKGSSASPRHQLLFWDQRGLGTIRLLDAKGLDRACGAAKLGPDGLVVTGDDLAERLGKSRRGVKVALLDQKAVAGIGNIYAAEILHRAAIDPRTPCNRLSAAAWEAVARAAREILASAVAHEGSSIGDELYRTADNRKGGFQKLHCVYGRVGTPCKTCGGAIQRIVQAQRSTFFCATCQPRPRSTTRRGQTAKPRRKPPATLVRRGTKA